MRKFKNIEESGLFCQQCGACCRTVALPISFEEVERKLVLILGKDKEKLDWDDYDTYFIYFNFTPLTREEAEKINPKMKLWPEGLNFFSCKALFENLCTKYNSRPRFCRLYPLPFDEEIPLYSSSCVFSEFEKSIRNGKYSIPEVGKISIGAILR